MTTSTHSHKAWTDEGGHVMMACATLPTASWLCACAGASETSSVAVESAVLSSSGDAGSSRAATRAGRRRIYG